MSHQAKVKELLNIEESQQNIREGFKLVLDEMWEAFRQTGMTDQESTTKFVEARDMALRLLSQLVP